MGDRRALGRMALVSLGLVLVRCGGRSGLDPGGAPSPGSLAAPAPSETPPSTVAIDLDAGDLSQLPLDATVPAPSPGPLPRHDASAPAPPLDGSVVCPTCPAPRAIAPLSTATVSSHRPTLRWTLADSEDGAQVEVCRDRACTARVARFTAEGASARLDDPLAPGVYYWHLRGASGGVVGTEASPVWEMFVGRGDAPVDTSWNVVLDVNGDGYADVVTSDKAHIYVYAGSATGLSHTAFALLMGAGVLSAAGDVDGDGFGDVVVGDSYGYLGTPGGYLLRGGEGGLDPTPVPIAYPGDAGYVSFGDSVSGAGDVNGDGYADVIFGAPGGDGSAFVYLGGPGGLGATPIALTVDIYYYGHFVASAGDVNGDGYADVVVGANPGIYFYFGGPQGLAPTALPLNLAAYGPNPVAGIDVNGDGYSDVVTAGDGTLEVYSGGPSGPSLTPTLQDIPIPGLAVYGQAFAIANAGDLNDDGFADVVYGDYLGAAVFYGSATGPASPTIFPSVGAWWTGWAVAGGDVNGDGYSDLVVSNGPPSAYSYLFYGGAAGVTWDGGVLLNGAFGAY